MQFQHGFEDFVENNIWSCRLNVCSGTFVMMAEAFVNLVAARMCAFRM